MKKRYRYMNLKQNMKINIVYDFKTVAVDLAKM